LTDVVATQPIFCIDQDLTAGLPAQFRSRMEASRRRWPRAFYMKMLMVGSPAAEGYLDCTEPWALEALRLAIEAYAKQTGCQLIVLKDLPACYRNKLGDFVRNGYQRVPGLPALELELDFATFEDYLVTRLSRVYRKNLRRKFRSLQNEEPIGFSWIQEPTSQIIDECFRLYWAVYEHAKFNFEVSNRDYLLRLADEIPDKIRLFRWRQGDRVIAFSMCLVHDGTLEEMYVGFDYQVATHLHLYFVTWRNVITWCFGKRDPAIPIRTAQLRSQTSSANAACSTRPVRPAYFSGAEPPVNVGDELSWADPLRAVVKAVQQRA